MEDRRRRFKMLDITLNENQTKQFEGASDLMFFNAGAGNIKIESITLLPGDTLNHPAFGDELNDTQYNIKFITPSTLVVTQKIYTKHG
jgi:hypothetical protein